MEKTTPLQNSETDGIKTSSDHLQPTPLKSRTLAEYLKERGFETQEELWANVFKNV